MKNYTLATEVNGTIKPLDLPLMAMRQAQAYAEKLRSLMPSATVYVINTTAQ
jgi:hypothetical protein